MKGFNRCCEGRTVARLAALSSAPEAVVLQVDHLDRDPHDEHIVCIAEDRKDQEDGELTSG